MNSPFMTVLLAMGLLAANLPAAAETEERNLPAFTEVSLRIPARVTVVQGSPRSVTLEARESTLREIITEISDRALVIRFPAKSYLQGRNDWGNIDIRITMPEVTGFSLSGSGEISAGEVNTLIMELNVSGSGNIELGKLNADRIKASIAGSGNIDLNGGSPASELSVSVAGSGNLRAESIEVSRAKVNIAGSGDCLIRSNGAVVVKIAGSGSLYYAGNPDIDATVAGSGRVKEIN